MKFAFTIVFIIGISINEIPELASSQSIGSSDDVPFFAVVVVKKNGKNNKKRNHLKKSTLFLFYFHSVLLLFYLRKKNFFQIKKRIVFLIICVVMHLYKTNIRHIFHSYYDKKNSTSEQRVVVCEMEVIVATLVMHIFFYKHFTN